MKCLGVSLLLLAITGVATTRDMPSSYLKSGGLLDCQLHFIAVTCERGVNNTSCHDTVECSPRIDDNTWSAHSYPIRGISKEFFQPHLLPISRGNMHALIPGGYIAHHAVIVPHRASIQLFKNPESKLGPRQLSRTLGVHNVVVLRISTPDSHPAMSASQLYDRIFSTSLTPTLVTQFAACSAGRLQMQQRLSGTGVVDILLSRNTNFYTSTNAMVAEATDVFTTRFNLEENTAAVTNFADHILFVLPPNSYIATPWIATATVGGWKVVCNDYYCGFISIFMHEVGHNLGLFHSNRNGVYNDQTGYMGSGVGVDYYPRECFNAANHWHLNWYSNRYLHVEPADGPVKFNLAAFVDYDKTTTDQPIVVQIGNSHYLQYNWATKYNADTVLYPNMVVYVQDLLTSTELLKALDYDGVNQRFVEKNFEKSGHDLVLEICGHSSPRGTASPVTITVGVGHGLNSSPCKRGLWVGVAGPIVDTPPTPTAQVTSRPTSPGPASPTPAYHCVDSPSTPFPVPSSAPSGSPRQRNCEWLRSRPRQQKIYCASNQLAKSTCAETCNLCGNGSSCADDATVKFIISGTKRSCRWVSRQSSQRPRLCRKRTDIRTSCAKTCHQCSALPLLREADLIKVSELMTPIAPNTSVPIDGPFIAAKKVCEDNIAATFRDARVGRRRSCFWLSKRPYFIHDYCVNNELVRVSCPVTCNLC